MSEHFITRCQECDDVICQCRCPSKDKQVKYEICKKCLSDGVPPLMTYQDKQIELFEKETGIKLDDLRNDRLYVQMKLNRWLLSKMETMEGYMTHQISCGKRADSDLRCICGLESITNKDGK